MALFAQVAKDLYVLSEYTVDEAKTQFKAIPSISIKTAKNSQELII